MTSRDDHGCAGRNGSAGPYLQRRNGAADRRSRTASQWQRWAIIPAATRSAISGVATATRGCIARDHHTGITRGVRPRRTQQQREAVPLAIRGATSGRNSNAMLLVAVAAQGCTCSRPDQERCKLAVVDEKRFIEAAVRLRTWISWLFGQTYVKDVYAYRKAKRWYLAISAPSLKLRKMIEAQLRNDNYRLDLSLARAFDIEQEIFRRDSRSHRIDGVSNQFFSSDAHIEFAEFLSGAEQAVSAFMANDGSHVIDVTVIPEGGEPYLNEPTKYFSVKRNRMLESKTPTWITRVVVRDIQTERDVTVPGANFCVLMPPLRAQRTGYAGLRASKDGMPIIVAHSLEFTEWKTTLATARLIRECGGMLFPSLSVGSMPAANFGPVSLIADPGLIQAGIKPWRVRGHWPVTVYSTDTWTPTTTTFLGSASATLYQQLTGQWRVDIGTATGLWTLGPEIQTEGGRYGGGVIQNAGQLLRTVRNRMKPWMQVDSRSQLERLSERKSEDVYGYLEAKVNSILPIEWFVAAFVPRWLAADAERWLREADFKGKLYALDTPAEIERAYRHDSWFDDQELWKLSWAQRVGAAAADELNLLNITG